nr:fbxl20 [Hymenolepis microstoma]
MCSSLQDVQPDVVEKIAQRCQGFLRELILRGCRNINDDAIRRFTVLCRLIEILDLSECQHLTDDACKYLGQNCPELQQLSLASCPNIGDVGMKWLSACERLTHLDVSWCSVGDEGLAAIAQGCLSLKELKVMGCHDISSRGVGHIASRSFGLLLLNLSHCGQNITDEAMIHLAMGCPFLRALFISLCHITDAGLRALAGTLPPTTAVEMLGITLPTGSSGGFQGLSTSTHAGNGRSMRSARHRPASETGGGLFANGSGGVSHRHSSASAYPLTTPSSPSGWLTGSASALHSKPLVIAGCKELRVLEISQCIQITDAGLAALARNCVNLEKLDLEYCSQVTDSTLIQLATYCPRINTLVLSHCDQITDEGISRLVEGLCGPQQLQRLAMDNCPLLTDSSLEMLGSVCQNLCQVDLYDCQLITRQGIENLKQQNPRLKIQAFFAPGTPPESALGHRRRYCRCCIIL